MDKNHGEILCEAVDIIVSERLKGISFDQTIIGTIVDDSRKVEGIYTVYYNDSVKFDAYSENTGYRKNNTVYIQIPQGDWSQQKFIIGKKTNKDEEKYIYSSAFSQFLDLTTNIIEFQEPKGLIANHETNTEILITTISNKEFSGYTRMGLSAEFRSWLRAEQVQKGHYGIRLKITGICDGQEESSQIIAELDSDDMLGNPYEFDSFYHQEKVFDISNINNIEKIEVYLYQNKDFKGINPEIEEELIDVSPVDVFGNDKPANLWCQDVYLAFGYDVSEYDGHKVILVSNDSKKYGATFKSEDNIKQIYLRWVEDLNGVPQVVDEHTAPEGTEIYWYRYELGLPSADAYSGVYWEYLTTWKKVENEWIENKDIVNDNLLKANSAFDLMINPDVTLQQEKIRVVIKFNGTIRYSSIIEFNNNFEVVSKPTVDAIQALNLLDDKFGNYRIYNLDNSLINSKDSITPRYLTALFKTQSMASVEGSDGKITADSITWEIPKQNTMLRINSTEGFDDTQSTEQKYILTKTSSPDAGGVVDSKLEYYIAPYFSQTYSNNTIVCKVEQYKTTYTAVQEFTFGPAGTTGTEATLILDFEGNKNAMTIPSEGQQTEAYIIKAHLYDYENNEIDLKTYKTTDLEYIWSWKDSKINSDTNEEVYPYTKYIIHQESKDEEGNNIPYQRELKFENISQVPSDNYHILQLTLKGFGDYTLTAFLPIPIRASNDYVYIEGAASIMYDTAGQVGDYFKNPYRLFKNEENSTETILEEAETTWALNGTDIGTNYFPKLESNLIKPLNFYVKDTNKGLCAYCVKNDTILWAQPILIVQNKYPSKTLNDWSGVLKIDEENNYILTAQIAAGKKESDNSFTGVIMGAWDTEQDAKEITKSGLYGYHKGHQSFGFKEDGTAFIGKSGNSQLNFNGTKGTIQNAGYESGQEGMQIDFDGTIHFVSGETTKIYDEDGKLEEEINNDILIDATAKKYPLTIGPYFQVAWDGSLEATNGEFDGIINAYGGTIGGWTIDETSLASENNTVVLNSDGELKLGGFLFGKAAESKNYYFVSGGTGSVQTAPWGMSSNNPGLAFYAGYDGGSDPVSDNVWSKYSFQVNSNTGLVSCLGIRLGHPGEEIDSWAEIKNYLDGETGSVSITDGSSTVKIGATKGLVDEISGSISLYSKGDIDGKISSLDSRIDKLEDDFATTITSQKKKIDELTTANSDLQGQLDTANETIEKKNGEIGELEDDIDYLERKINRLEDEIERLEGLLNQGGIPQP